MQGRSGVGGTDKSADAFVEAAGSCYSIILVAWMGLFGALDRRY